MEDGGMKKYRYKGYSIERESAMLGDVRIEHWVVYNRAVPGWLSWAFPTIRDAKECINYWLNLHNC